MKPSPRPFPLIFGVALVLALVAAPPLAAQRDETPYDDDQDDGVRQRVARIAYVGGEAALNRGDDPDDWQPVTVNYPLSLGDRVYTPRDARMVLETDGATILLSGDTELAFLDLVDGRTQLAVNIGTASFRVHELGRDEVFEVATPNASVTFSRAGWYRVDVDAEGNTRAVVQQGRAWAAAGGGEVGLYRGDAISVDGLERPRYDVFDAPRADSWDRWVENRMRASREARAESYVPRDVYGAADLDGYGSWQQVPDYGWAWYPTVSAGWMPYRQGRWAWRDPWGWTWVSSEPWGWAPYHWGRWVTTRGRWCWVPGAARGPRVRWSPALVAFVGGSDFSVSVSVGGFVGWFPLGPRDPFFRWWGSRPSSRYPHVTYANRTYVTVVNRDVFVSGRYVDRSVVRDTRVLREVASGPVIRGTVPVVPTRDSIRSEVDGRRTVSVPREGIVARPVVTRTAPPPAPPRFDRKVEVIRERGGEPISPEAAARLAPERSSASSRPVSREGGAVVLTPARPEAAARRPEPVVPPSRDGSRRGEPLPSRVEEPASPPSERTAPPARDERPSSPRPERTVPPARDERPSYTPEPRERREAPTPRETRPPERREVVEPRVETPPPPPPVRIERSAPPPSAPAPAPPVRVERSAPPASAPARVDRPVEKPVERPAEKPTAKPADKPSSREGGQKGESKPDAPDSKDEKPKKERER